MSVRVHLPTQLIRLHGLTNPLECDGATVAEVIADLDRRVPGLGHGLADAGELRRHVLVFVDRDQAGMGTPVADGTEVRFVAAVAGG